MEGDIVNRTKYFNYIEEHLNFLSYRIKMRGRINLLELNIHSETFFAELFHYLLGYDLTNLNQIKQNTAAIDLIDEHRKIIVQVSSTCTKQKIENSLSKDKFLQYPNYKFIFIAIAGDAGNLRTKSFANPYNVLFEPQNDIYDIMSLNNIILGMNINHQKELYEFIKDELGIDLDIVKVDSNLATIINILSQENLATIQDSPEINSFEIERKIEFNNLITAIDTINDYKIYYSKLNEKYNEFDKQGANKSLSVLSTIRKQYINMLNEDMTSHDLFFDIIDKIINIITSSQNYSEIPFEELEMCVSIVVVDAFIRCKIFENPEGYQHVTTR